MKCPATGKKVYADYAAALKALDTLIERPELGSVYTCPTCGAFHISKRRFVLRKVRGRGKSRKGLVMA